MEPLFDINKTGPMFKVNPIDAKPFINTEQTRKSNGIRATIPTICMHCRFFVPIEYSDTNKHEGECRRYPPVGGQLLVTDDYGCGEFYPRPL